MSLQRMQQRRPKRLPSTHPIRKVVRELRRRHGFRHHLRAERIDDGPWEVRGYRAGQLVCVQCQASLDDSGPSSLVRPTAKRVSTAPEIIVTVCSSCCPHAVRA